MSFKAQLFGANELIEQFKRLGDAVATKYVDEAMQACAEVGYEAIQRQTPVESGLLKSEIRLSTLSKTRQRVVKAVKVGAGAPYWRYLEYGKRILGHDWIRRAFKNRKGTARTTIRDTFRDKMNGFS